MGGHWTSIQTAVWMWTAFAGGILTNVERLLLSLVSTKRLHVLIKADNLIVPINWGWKQEEGSSASKKETPDCSYKKKKVVVWRASPRAVAGRSLPWAHWWLWVTGGGLHENHNETYFDWPGILLEFNPTSAKWRNFRSLQIFHYLKACDTCWQFM
jgi:hypothetical protein